MAWTILYCDRGAFLYAFLTYTCITGAEFTAIHDVSRQLTLNNTVNIAEQQMW